MRIETISFLLVLALLFIVFTSHTKEAFLVSNSDDGADNKISFASLAVVSPPYSEIPEISELQFNTASIKVSVLRENNSIYNFQDSIRWPIASLTKLLTSIVAIEKLGLNKIIKITTDDILAEGDAGNFKSSEEFSVRDLIIAMLTVSSNDSAHALAGAYGYNNFIEALKDKAFAIGMRDSSFTDPAGLSVLNQSTAVDLEKLASYILKNYPELLAISRNKENYITEIISGSSHKLININKFSGDADFIGGKTGYTEEARGNLISIFNWHNKNILIIVLGADDRFLETTKLYNWVKGVLE